MLVQFGDGSPYLPQAEAMASGVGLSVSERQTRPLLPSHSLIAVLRQRRVPSPLARFAVAKVMGLQD